MYSNSLINYATSLYNNTYSRLKSAAHERFKKNRKTLMKQVEKRRKENRIHHLMTNVRKRDARVIYRSLKKYSEYHQWSALGKRTEQFLS